MRARFNHAATDWGRRLAAAGSHAAITRTFNVAKAVPNIQTSLRPVQPDHIHGPTAVATTLEPGPASRRSEASLAEANDRRPSHPLTSASAPTFAPRSSSSLATSRWPCLHAAISGVGPTCDAHAQQSSGPSSPWRTGIPRQVRHAQGHRLACRWNWTTLCCGSPQECSCALSLPRRTT